MNKKIKSSLRCIQNTVFITTNPSKTFSFKIATKNNWQKFQSFQCLKLGTVIFICEIKKKIRSSFQLFSIRAQTVQKKHQHEEGLIIRPVGDLTLQSESSGCVSSPWQSSTCVSSLGILQSCIFMTINHYTLSNQYPPFLWY